MNGYKVTLGPGANIFLAFENSLFKHARRKMLGGYKV